MWCYLEDETIKIREIDEILEWFTGNTINTCSSTNTCVNWISINEFGEVYPCEYKRFVGKIMHMPEECKKCEFYSKCGNSCYAT